MQTTTARLTTAGESLTIEEHGAGARGENRACAIRVVLLAAYHDCLIELTYPKVYSSNLGSRDSATGAGDWRYDEFRVTDDGRVIHEIEWASGTETACLSTACR